MQPAPAWQIIDIREGARFDDLNRPVQTRVVRYRIGTDGPFTLAIDAVKFSSATVKAALDEQAAHFAVLHPPAP